MSIIKNYFYNKRLKHLEECLKAFKKEQNDSYQAEKRIEMKNGKPVYLVHCTLSEDGQLFGGFIYVLTTKGFNGCLSYTVLRGNDPCIYIGEFHHKILDQGIGTQSLSYLDEIARYNGFDKISGWLSPIDLRTNRKKLFHFYEKNGYQIAEGKDPAWQIKGLIATKCL